MPITAQIIKKFDFSKKGLTNQQLCGIINISFHSVVQHKNRFLPKYDDFKGCLFDNITRFKHNKSIVINQNDDALVF